MEEEKIAKCIVNGLALDARIERVVSFCGDKSLQVFTVDGDLYNIGIRRAHTVIKREAVYEKEREHKR